MSGSGFRGRGFGPRGIRPGGPSGGRGGPRFPRPPFNRLPFPRHGSENWHEHPAQPFFPPWQYNGRGHYPKFPLRPPFRHDIPFHRGRGRGQNVRGMPLRMQMPGAPGLCRPKIQSENEVYASPSDNEQHERSASLPQTSPAPPLGSEEERQQKITEAADKLKQKLSSIKNQEVENFWEDDIDLIASTSSKEASNKEEIAQLHPHDFSLTFHDLKDIGRVDLHRTLMQDDSVVVLDEVCNRNFVEISLLDEEIRISEGESECHVPNNEVEEEIDNGQENAINEDIKNIHTLDSTMAQSQENTALQTHQDNTPNFTEEIPHHNPSVSFNCRPEFHRGNVNTPPRFIPRQMEPRFRMPYPQEISPMGPGKPIPLRPIQPNCRPPPNQLDVPRVMFDPHTPPPAVFNRPPPPSNFHPMDQNLSMDTPSQMQADSMHSGVRFDPREPPPRLSSPSKIQCNSSNEERMNFPDFDPRKPPPSVIITQEEVLQPPPVFDPRLSFQERQRLIPTVAPAQLHQPLSMQVPPSTIPPPPPLSGPPPPPAPPGSLLEMVPMTDFDIMPNYSMANNFDMAQSHFPQMNIVQPLPQQEVSEPEQNYIDIEGELFMEPPPEPPILSDYCSPPLPETLPPADAPLPPVDAPLPPVDAPLPPMDVPLPPVDAPLPPADTPLPPSDAPLPPLGCPLPPADILLPSTEVPLSSTEVPLSMSEPPSVLFSNKQVSKTLRAAETLKQQEPPRVSKEAIPTSISQPKMDIDKPKQKRFKMRKSKRENAATCSAPIVSMSPNDKVHTVQNQDNSKQYQHITQEEVPLSEEQSRPKVVFNLNAKIKKISKQEEWQQQADTSAAKHRKLKAQMISLDSPTSTLRVKSHSQLRKTPSPKSSKSLTSSRKGTEGKGRISESSWKSTVIERFLKMSKNEIRNILNNSSLRKFDIAMKQLVKERRSSLSWEMRNTEDEKIKSYDREQFICQLNEMLDPSATIDITNLPTEFIRHLGEVLQLNSLPQDQTDLVQNTEVEVTPVRTISKSESAESTYHKLHGKAISRSLIKEDTDISMNSNEVHEETIINNVQINVEQSRESQDSLLNMDLDDIFLAGIAKAKHGLKSATPEKAVTDFDLFFGPSGSGASQSPMVTESVSETEKIQEDMTFVENRIDKCERWHRKARDDPDMFRNLTKEEWEAKYGKSINGDEISKPPSSLDGNESSSNKEDISIDSVKSLSIKNVIDQNPRVRRGTTLLVNKYVSNIAKSSSLRQEYQSNKGRSSSDSNSMAVAEVIESMSPIEMSRTTWRERSIEPCPPFVRSLRETKSGEESNERRSMSETRRDKSFMETGSDRKHREEISSSRKSRRRERKRKTKKEKERRKRKRRATTRESSSSYSDSESDSMTLFTELEIKKEIIVKDEPGLDEKVESSVEKMTSRPDPTDCNNHSALQELTTDKTLLANKTIVTNHEPVTNTELITSQESGTSQESSTGQECTSNTDTSLQMRKQSIPKILEMSKVPNKVLMECFEKESASLKTVADGNNANSQAVDTVTVTNLLESTSKKSYLTKLEVQKEKNATSASRSVKNKVSHKSKEEKNDTSVTVLTKDAINIPQKSDKHSKDTVPKDAASIRSSSIEGSLVKKSGREAVDKVDIGNGTVRSKSNEERPSMKFQNIKSEGRKEMKLIEEKAKKRSSSMLRDKKSSATKHSKMLTTELKSPKVKIQKEKTSSGTADSSQHRKQIIQIQIPTEDNPDLKDPRLSKLKERVQQSPNKSAKDSHSKIISEKSVVDSMTEEQSKQQTQHCQSTLTSHGNVIKTLHDIKRNVQTPLTVETCTVDSNLKAAENTSPEVTSPGSLDSPFKGFSEESQLPSEQLARRTLLRSRAEFLNGSDVSDRSILEETDKNSALCIRTTSPNEDYSFQSQKTTSIEVLPEKSEEPKSYIVTNLLVISASGNSCDIQKDDSIEVQVSSDSLNEKAESDKLIIDKETHVQRICIDADTCIDENIEQNKVHDNILDIEKSGVEKLQNVDNPKEARLEKETSEIVEKLEPEKIFDPLKIPEQEVMKSLEVEAEIDEVQKSSAVVKLIEPVETPEVEKVAVVAKKYELVKIDTTVKPMLVTKGQEVEKSAVAGKLQETPKIHELAKTTEPLKVVDVVKSFTIGKSHEKVKSHEGVKSSVAKKTQERHKSHEVVNIYDAENLPVAEKAEEITKTRGTKRLETDKTCESAKLSLVRKTRDRNKTDEVKKSTVIDKTQEYAKIHDTKQEHMQMPEVVKSSAEPKRHDVTTSPEVVKFSVELKTHDLVDATEVEKKAEVVKSSVILKRHDNVKSSEVEEMPEVTKSPVILKRHEVINSSDVQKVSEMERALEVLKPPVVLKRHDFLKSHEVVKSCEGEKMPEVVKAFVVLKSHDSEKIQEIVKPSVLLRSIDVKSPTMEKLQDVVKPSVVSKRHEVSKSPIMENTQVIKPSTTLKSHEEVKSPVAEKTQEVIKPSTTLKRHKVVKSPLVEKGQEVVKPPTTLKRYEEVKSPVVEKTQEVVKPSTTLRRHEEVKSPVAEKEQEVVKPSITLKRHKVEKSPVVEKGQEGVKPSITLETHEEVKSPVAIKEQEVVKSSTTSKRHKVVKSPVAEKTQEVIKPSTTLRRHEEVKSPVAEKEKEAVKSSTTLKRYKVVKSPVVEKGQQGVKPSITLERHEEVKSPVAERDQEVIKSPTKLERHTEVTSPIPEKEQEVVKPSTTSKRYKVVKSPIVEKGQEVVKPSTTSKRHKVVKSPVVEKGQEVVKPSITFERHEEIKSFIVEETEEMVTPSTTLESHEVVNSSVAETTQEVLKPSEALKSYEEVKSSEMEKPEEAVKMQEQVKTCEITNTHEVAKPLVEHVKAHEVPKIHEPSASTSKSINTEVTQIQAEIIITTESQDQLNRHCEKSQEKSPEAGVSHPSVTKGQHVSSLESSKIEEKLTKRRRVSRWQDNDNVPKVIEPIQYLDKPKNKPRARKQSKKHDSDPLRKIRSRPKFKDKKSKAPTTLDKILSRENAMSKESVMSRMIEIDLEIHKLMTEKMTLYQLLENESLLLDDNQDNTKDNNESRNKKKKEASNEKLTPPRLSAHNRLSLEKGHHSSHQSTHGARSKAILFDDSQADHDSPRKDTLLHVFDSSCEKHQRHTPTSTSEAKEGRSVDHVNIEADKSNIPPENNKGKKRLRLDKPDIEKTHKNITSSEESLNALNNYKKTISKPDKKSDNDVDTAREVSVEIKSSTGPKYSKDNDDSTKVKENVLEDQRVTRIIEDRLQSPFGVDEESKSSENVSKRSDSKTMERLSIYSDDSTRESSLTPESSEAKKCTTGLALLEETFRREKAISRRLKAAARKQKKEEMETLLKNVNSLTADEEEIPLNVLYEMKQKQKQHLLEEMGVKSKVEKLTQKSEENSAIIWKHVMAVINAVAENRTKNLAVETYQPEVPSLGQLVELSTEPTLLEIETTVKPSDTDKIDDTCTLETMTSILKNVPEPAVSVEIPTANSTSKTPEFHTLNESRHEELVHTANTPASTANTEKDLISKDSKEEKSDVQSDTLSKNEVKKLSSKVAINDMTDSLKNDHDEKIDNENERLNEDERNIHEISITAETEKENEDSSVVLNKKSADNIECPGILIESEDNSINESLTSNLDNTLVNAETENEVTDSNLLDVQKDKVIVTPERESSPVVKEVDLVIKSKEGSNTPLELESLKEINEAVKETMENLVNSVPELTSAETISRVNEDCSQKKDEGRHMESIEINSQTEEILRNSVMPTEIIVQPSTSTSEENETVVIKRGRGRPKKRLSTNSSLSGTMSPVPSTSTISEKTPKNVQPRSKRKSIVLEPRAARKRRRTRWSSRSSIELPGVSKEADPLETTIGAELLPSKGISLEEFKKRKSISQLQLKNCKVRLIDCESTYLRPDCDPNILQQYGISRINAYGRTICIQREPSLKIEDNKRFASVTSVQEVITPGYDIVHVESDKEKDSSSFCSWDQNIQEIPESIDVSQDSMSQEEITELRRNDHYETTENHEDTPDNEHVYLSHLDPTVLRQDEASSPQPVIDINEDESAANTSSQSDIEILEATKESRLVNQAEDTEGENVLTTAVLEEEKSLRTEYTVHKGPVLDIKVYGDSFMAASEDGTIYRYSQVSNGILNIYRGHKSAVTCLCIPKINFSGISRQWLFSGSLDGTLRCYEIDTGQQVRESVDIGSPIQCMDHAWGVIFLGTKSGHVSRFHIKSGVMKGDNIQFSEVSVLALKATSEGPRRVLIVASRNQPITIRDAQNGLFLRTVSGHKNHTVYSLMMDHHMVYCGTSGTLIPVFDFITAEQVAQYNAGVGIVCMRLYKKLLFAGCYDGNIYVFNTKDRKLVCSIPGPGNMLLSMEVVDNKIIAGSKDRGLHIWLMPKAVRALINNRSRNARRKEI